jgi:hypothetical protein
MPQTFYLVLFSPYIRCDKPLEAGKERPRGELSYYFRFLRMRFLAASRKPIAASWSDACDADYFLRNAKTKVAVGFEVYAQIIRFMESRSRLGLSRPRRTLL